MIDGLSGTFRETFDEGAHPVSVSTEPKIHFAQPRKLDFESLNEFCPLINPNPATSLFLKSSLSQSQPEHNAAPAYENK